MQLADLHKMKKISMHEILYIPVTIATSLAFTSQHDLKSSVAFFNPLPLFTNMDYRQVSNIRGTFAGNKIVDHSDVAGASPVGAAPTTSSFST